MLASRMSDFYKSDVGFLQVGCPIFTSRMSDFNKSDVGFLQVGRRIFTRRMLDVGCRIFKVGCRMAPISFRTYQRKRWVSKYYITGSLKLF